MKKLYYLIISTIAFAPVTHANADDSWYVGSFLTTQNLTAREERVWNSAGLTTGYQYNEFIAIEARLGKGVIDYEKKDSYSYIKDSINWQASLFVKGSYPILESVDLYGLAGYTYIEQKLDGYFNQYDQLGILLTTLTLYPKHKDETFTYGVGLSYSFESKISVYLDYVKFPEYAFYDDDHWNITSIGINYRF